MSQVLTCRIEPDAPLVCGEMTSRTLHFAVQQPLARNGRIRLWFTQSPYYRLPPGYGLPAKGWVFFARVHLQAQDPQGAGYVSAAAASGWPVALEITRGKCFFDVVCPEGLAAGDALWLTLGDRSAGGPGVEAAHNTTRGDWPLLCEVDAAGDGDFVRQDAMPALRVVAAPPAQLLARLPSQARPGQPLDLHLTVIDRYGNTIEGYAGIFSVNGGSDTLHLSADDGGVKRFPGRVAFADSGIRRVHVTSVETPALAAASNPVRVAAADDGYALLWGDLHGHTYCTDGTHSPRAFFEYARHTGGLDFCALTDHDSFSHEVWQEMMAVAAAANAPGAFTTFLGYEWDGDLAQTIVVYYRDAAGGYYPNREIPGRSWREFMARVAHHDGTMVIRHDMPPLGERWQPLDASGRWERLVEIYSPFHASEAAGAPQARGPLDAGNSVQAALADGLRFGFVSCSDSHLSMPGRRYGSIKGYPQARTAYPYGLTAVYATANTRAALFEALRARRCYAATDRIGLDVRLNGHRMGEEVRLAGPRAITVWAAGTAPFRQVDVLKNNQVVHRAAAGATEAEFTYRDDTAVRPGDYYYVRVEQEDGGMAWASPIWVDPAT